MYNLISHFPVPKTLTFKRRLDAQPFLWKWVLFAWEWKKISISKAEHVPSFWNRGLGERGTGLLKLRLAESKTVGYSRVSTNGHLSTTATSLQWPCFFGGQSIHQLLYQTLYNGHLSTIATFFCPQGGRCGGSTVYKSMAQRMNRNTKKTNPASAKSGTRTQQGPYETATATASRTSKRK